VAERVVKRENNGLQHKKSGECEGGKNSAKKIMIIKLIIKKRKK
jgi:hypothetical protein